MKRPKTKFSVGQVICVMGIERIGDPDEYGVVDGYDDGRWHIKIGGRELKCLPEILRPLTKSERGAAGRSE